MTNRWTVYALVVLTLPALGPWRPCLAQSGAVRGLAEEVTERWLATAGRGAADDLAAAGGVAGVRAALARAAEQGGEPLARRVAAYAQAEGAAALRLIDRSPAAWVAALDGLSRDLVRPAVWAASREPELASRLVAAHGARALEVAVRHPGVGLRIADRLGGEGIDLALTLPTDQAVLLTRHADELARLAPASRAQALARVRAAPAAALRFLEAHPRTLATAAGLAAFLAAKDNFLGEPGVRTVAPDGTITEPAPGLLGRLADRLTARASEPVHALLALGGALLAAWGVIQLWHVWRVKQLRRRLPAAAPGT